ncbi:MAG: XRE family transcriptional regulator [Bacillota bacterium]
MRINKQKFREDIFIERFNGNYSRCAHAINIEPQQLHRFLNQQNSEAGAKLLGGFFAYCEKEGLAFKEYIFLPNNSTTVYPPTGTEGDGGYVS